MLRTQELSALLDAIDRLRQPVTRAQFPAHLFAILADLLPGTVASFDFVELATGRVESHIMPSVSVAAIAELEGVVRQYAWQNPVVSHLANGHLQSVVQPTDFLTQRQFRRMDLYQLSFRPLGIEYQIAWKGYAGGLIVNRRGTRNFAAREVELLRRLRPHVETAYAHLLQLDELRSNLQARTSADAPGSDPTTIALTQALTAREPEVLRWVSEGKRNSDIATILGVSTRTVDKHVEHLFAKLGVETRTAAAMIARTI